SASLTGDDGVSNSTYLLPKLFATARPRSRLNCLVALTFSTPSSSTKSSTSLVAGPVSFFDDVATFQIAPPGSWTTPPYPQNPFAAGLIIVAPPASAVPMRLSTVLGWDTTTASMDPRKPVVGACEARRRTLSPSPNAAVQKASAPAGSGTSRGTDSM